MLPPAWRWASLLALCSAALEEGNVRRSTPGCDSVSNVVGGHQTISVEDPELGLVVRNYDLFIPDNLPTRTTPERWSATGAPLLLGFHGQSGDPWGWGPREHFIKLAGERGWVAVFPAGLLESGDRKVGDSTWNVGTSGDDETCQKGTKSVNCMISCQRLGLCSRCNWSTCYNDVIFIERLLEHLERNVCLDPRRYFAVGESNGGMMVHYLIKQMPGRFLAAAPVYGSPLLGYLVGSDYQLILDGATLHRTSVLQLHGRNDHIIPGHGGISVDGWIYESMPRAIGVWAALHRCSKEAHPMQTDYSGGPRKLACSEFASCNSQGRVAYCWYNGRHGEWPDQPRAAELIWSFFESVSPRSLEVFFT